MRARRRLPRPAPRRRRGAATPRSPWSSSPGSAGAAGDTVPHATDPAATADALLFQRLGGPAVISRRGPEIGLPGRHPTIGGRFVATVIGDTVQLFDRGTLAPWSRRSGRPGADAIAVSDTWLAYRASARRGRRDLHPLHRQPGGARPRRSCSPREGGASQLSPPAVDGNTLLYALATPRGSRVVQRVMGTRKAPGAGALAAAPALRSRRQREAPSPTCAATRAAAG